MNSFDYFFENTSKLDKMFLVGKEEISFKNLYESALHLASGLNKEFGEKKHILLISANNVFFLKTYFAIIKSGNICIPLDPAIEQENFNYITEVTKPALIYLTADIKRKLAVDKFNCITPDELEQNYHDIQLLEKNPEYDKENCAEIIFTSGSTGKPKGVMISHKNLIANTMSIIEYLKLSQNDRMLVVLPFYYCYGLSLLHTHLRTGGSIVINNSFIFLGGIINNL